jgi:hypothetical protein
VVTELYCRVKRKPEKSALMVSVIIRNLHQIIRVITSKRRRWNKHVAGMGRKNSHRILVWKPAIKRPPERLGIKGKTIFKYFLRKCGGVRGGLH